MLELSQTVVADEMQIGHASHPGRSGKNNEDYYGIFSVATSGGECVVAAVADGIGGSVGGEQASRQTIAAISQFLKDQHYVATSLGQRLDQAIRLANHAVYEKSQTEPALLGMGTTIVAAALDSDRLYIVHAGDSRAYLVRGGRAYQLTLDHSWAQEAIEAGRISVEDAKTHPNRHVIRRYLGINEDVETDLRVLDPGQGKSRPARPVTVASPILTRPGDAILLCTDGLTDEVGDEEIAKIVARHAPEDAARRLIDAANAAGGADNITAVILQRGKGGSAAVAGRSRFAAYALAVLGVLLVAALGWLLASGSLLGGTATGAAFLEPSNAAPDAVISETAGEDSGPTAMPASLSSATSVTASAAVTATDVMTEEITAAETTAAAIDNAAASAQQTTPPPALAASAAEQQPTGGGTAEATAPEVTSTPVQAVAATGAVTDSASLTERSPAYVGNGAGSATAAAAVPSTAPTSTPIQRTTSTATPTVTPTNIPRNTDVPRVATSAPSPASPTAPAGQPYVAPQPPAAAPPEPSVEEEGGPTALSNVQPGPNSQFGVNNSVTFSWQPNAPILPDQLFEFVFWQPDQQWLEGRSPAAAMNDTFYTMTPKEAGSYRWGVLLVRLEPTYKRIRLLGPDYLITFSGSSGSGGGGNGGGGGGEPTSEPDQRPNGN